MNIHLLGIALLAAVGIAAISSADAQQAQPKPSYTSTIGNVELNADSSYQDLPKVNAKNAVATHRFALLLPKGASLHPVAEEEGQRFLKSEILVKDQQGRVIGSIDSAWAQDASGKSLTTFFTIEGQTLVKTIDTSNAAEKIATAVLLYNRTNTQANAEGSTTQQTKAYVGIPSNYVYNLNHVRKTLHDYCTKSPDEFPNPVGANANFRGPCARHDMRFEARSSSQYTCNNNLRSNMRSNCEYSYAWYNPARGLCYDTANVYWIAVTANTIWPG